MVLQVGIHNIWLEIDCQEVMELWQTCMNHRSSIVTILEEIRDLSTHFQGFKFSFIARSCNEIAHILAKQITCDIRVGRWSYVPTCISNLLTPDCNFVFP
jgi:hypothetical protein